MDCRHHPVCPGCPLISEPYPAQLLAKAERLRRAFARYPHLGRVPDVLPARLESGYRHRLKLPVQVSKDHVRIGLLGENNQILDTPDCPILDPGLRDTLDRVLAWMRGRNGIHSLDLRRSAKTGEVQAVFACLGGDLLGGAKAVRQLMADVPAITSVAVSVADPERKRVMGRNPEIVAGKPFIAESIGATEYRLFPGAFFQVDPVNAERLHALVRAAVGDAKSILDLYAGVGAYALMLAPGRDRVVMVEEVTQAVRAARSVAPPNVEVVESKVEALELKDRFDVAILNPARKGSDPQTLARIANLVPKLVYVSCGPETLARDLDCLAAHGMRMTSVQPLDLFPQTPEVEAVVVVERGSAIKKWNVPGGAAYGPWLETPWSGVKGRPTRVLAMVLHDTGEHGEVPGGRYRKIATVATHSLIRIELQGPLVPALAYLARRGHAVVGRDLKTKAFFAEKAGLVRPFVHAEQAGGARAPLHGDLVEALIALGADERTVARAGGVFDPLEGA
jgi:23S rRNA (uracil1939-C5)-methyltransferase